ncbi:MAG: peptidoglycan -binding protein [Paracoccaceae bacterium]
MALSRRSSQRMSANVWPGFVDAMTALLLVLMFVLTIFMIMQFVLSETITGQESQLDELTLELTELAQALGLEQQNSFQLDEQVSLLDTTLDQARSEAEAQQLLIANLTLQTQSQTDELNARQTQITSFEAQVATLLSERNAARAQGAVLAANVEDLETQQTQLISEQEALQLALAGMREEVDAQAEAARLAAARRQALDALVLDLRNRVSDRDLSLTDALAQLETSQNQTANQTARVQELATALSDEEAARLAEAAAAKALQDRLTTAEIAVSEAEKLRLAEIAAAVALRERLKNSDAELTAMSLALEEKRQEAEDTLTLIAAAKLVENDLNDRLVAALLAQETLQSQVSNVQTNQTSTADQLATAKAALAAALLKEESITARLNIAESDQLETASKLKSVESALAVALMARDEFRGNLQAETLQRGEIEARLQAMEIALADITLERDVLQTQVSNSGTSNADISERLAVANAALAVALTEADALKSNLGDEAELRKSLAAALAAKLAAQQKIDSQLSQADQRAALLSVANDALAQEEAKSAESQRKLAVLNEQVAALRAQLGSLQAILEITEERDADAQVELTNLGARLNTALARVASEESKRARLEADERKRLEAEATQLAKYRSEFFGQISELLGDREGVKIVGDRFVFSSEVLFESASVVLADDGKSQITRVAALLAEVSDAIPPEIDWVIRVDGHTDDTPLLGTGRYRNNWELSQARALSVVQFMIDDLGFPATRLAATGFGEFQPLAIGDSPQDRAQNRRIELKLTER